MTSMQIRRCIRANNIKWCLTFIDANAYKYTGKKYMHNVCGRVWLEFIASRYPAQTCCGHCRRSSTYTRLRNLCEPYK